MAEILYHLFYYPRLWWLKRQIRIITYRRRELHVIIDRELCMLDYEEAVANRKLRELQSDKMHRGLVEVKS